MWWLKTIKVCVSGKCCTFDFIGAAGQGSYVAVSSDGNTLAFGGQNDNTNVGASWVFTRSAGVWTQQGLKLIGTGATVNARQGYSVALSANGNTLAIGARLDDSDIGATWVFTRTAGVWTQQGSKLVGTGAVGTAQQGYSIDLSSNGNTLAIGGLNDDSAVGAI